MPFRHFDCSISIVSQIKSPRLFARRLLFWKPALSFIRPLNFLFRLKQLTFVRRNVVLKTGQTSLYFQMHDLHAHAGDLGNWQGAFSSFCIGSVGSCA